MLLPLFVFNAAAAAVARAQLDQFLPPQAGKFAAGGEIGALTEVGSAAACGAACLAQPARTCISFNVLDSDAAFSSCGIKGECYAPNATSCPAVLSFMCYGGVFDGVAFASYGTPTTLPGTCQWAHNASCDAASSAAVVAAACVGRSTCSIEVGVGTFGADPCPGVYKFLAASLTGNCSAPPPGALLCQSNGYARNYSVGAAANASAAAYYQRLQPRNDTRVVQAVPYVLSVPTGNVTIARGVLLEAFNGGIEYLLGTYTVDDMLVNFRKRAGDVNPPGHCIGWDCTADWIEGSIAALFLMGAGGHLRWVEQPQLRSMMDALIDGIENCTEPDGYLAAFAQAKLATDEHPDYTTSWTVHGFLEAAVAGNAKALRMVRAHMNVFNNHTLLPTFLPPDGGNWPYQEPVGPWPPGADNRTATGSGTLTGHTVYLIDQGLIHQTRMALSPAGTQADVDLVASIYQEPWWLQMLGDRNLEAIWHKVWFPHNYKVTAFEAYADMYILTGQQLYLDAVMGAWSMLRDPSQGWIHVGGSFAINEGDYYAPGSYHIEYGTHAMGDAAAADYDAAAPKRPHREDAAEEEEANEEVAVAGAAGAVRWGRKRDWFRAERGRLAGEVGWEAHDHDLSEHRHAHGHHHGFAAGHGDGSDWNGLFPTGEFCGAMFWLKLNQRFHRLWPDNETFVGEIEREVYNEALTHQAPNGSGIRYFSNLNGVKEQPGRIGTCCEGQGTRLYGSLNEYLFSLAPAGLYVDIYAPSSIAFTIGGSAVTVAVDTAFPADGAMRLTVTASPPVAFDLALRMPAWAGSVASVPVTVDGVPTPSPGVPGSYLHVQRQWSAAGTVVAYTLPMAFAALPYTGTTPTGPGPALPRFAYTLGPVLLAATSATRWNATAKTLVVPAVDGAAPAAWMTPAGDGNPLHFAVAGVPDVLFQPLWEIGNGQVFSAYPAFPSSAV